MSEATAAAPQRGQWAHPYPSGGQPRPPEGSSWECPHTALVTARGPQHPDSVPGPPLSPCWVPDNWDSKPPGLGVSSPQRDQAGGAGAQVRTPPGVWQGIGGGEVAPEPRPFQAGRAAPGSCAIHPLPGYPACSCLAGGKVHSSWTSLALYRAFPLVNTHSQQSNKGGWREAAGMSGSPSLWPINKDCCVPCRPHPGRGLEGKERGAGEKEGRGRGERRERGGFPDPRTSSDHSGSLCPYRARSSAPAVLRTARGITSFRQSLRSSQERPGEAFSSLVGAGPHFRAALPPARHCLSSPVHFRALPHHHTSPGQDAGPHQSRPTAGGELQGSRGPSEAPGPRIGRAWTSAGGKGPPE